jgi:hypothetical protein
MKDYTGMRSGRLLAIEPTNQRLRKGILWLFQCDCGNKKLLVPASLGVTKSCGCLLKENGKHNFIHGHNGSKGATWQYYLWRKLKRQNLLKDIWRDDLQMFVSCIGNKQQPYLVRLDLDNLYGPDNFVWSAKKEFSSLVVSSNKERMSGMNHPFYKNKTEQEKQTWLQLRKSRQLQKQLKELLREPLSSRALQNAASSLPLI